MPLIKNITAISYSSQDSKHPLSGLLSGSGSWLCAADDRSGQLTADLQLDRALTISYIDVGNYNSMTLSIDVSRSCGTAGGCSLLPTVTLATPQQLREQQPQCKAVRMFKADDLNQAALKERWDRVRVTCTQPFKRGLQYGLAFLKFYCTDSLDSISYDRMNSLPSFNFIASASNSPCVTAKTPARLCLNSENDRKSSDQKKLLNKPVHHGQDHKSTSIFNIKTSKLITSDKEMIQGSPENSLRITNKNKGTATTDNSFNPLRHNNYIENIDPLLTRSPASGTPVGSLKKNPLQESGKSSSAASRFRSALEKLCAEGKTEPPVVVARRRFLSRITAASTGDGCADAGPSAPAAAERSRGARDESSRSSGESPNNWADLQQEFEYESLEFLISLDLQEKQILELRVADVRMQFEASRGAPLSRPQRCCFKNLALDFCGRRLNCSDQSSAENRLTPAVVRPSSASVCPSSAGSSTTSKGSISTGVAKKSKFTFKKLNFDGPGDTRGSPTGMKNNGFNRASPMPFNDDHARADGAGPSAPSPRNNVSVSRSPVVSPLSKSTKKRRKEEPKPVANGEWVSSKRIRTKVSRKSTSPSRKDVDVIEVVELNDEIDEFKKQWPSKDSGFIRNEDGWIQRLKSSQSQTIDSWELSDVSSIASNSPPGPSSKDKDKFSSPAFQPSHNSNNCVDEEILGTNSGVLRNYTALSNKLPDVVCPSDSLDELSNGTNTAENSQRNMAVSKNINTDQDLRSINSKSGFQLGAAPVDKYGLNSRRLINTDEEQEPEDRVACPLCGGLFVQSAVEEHAATCRHDDVHCDTEAVSMDSCEAENLSEPCPVCQKRWPRKEFECHVISCAERNFAQ
ncbi:uncharacterized protein LOC108667834 [Hyalella azteca]|uniref:Uncharacterized protein LOC108667834 n=1 Tax=Hyalella azteca TaxID=294128 RepID=A0A8B7N970_HYAAZ|nr:uncharacterized protein LOC108667834 [Hyalella azteca]